MSGGKETVLMKKSVHTVAFQNSFSKLRVCLAGIILTDLVRPPVCVRISVHVRLVGAAHYKVFRVSRLCGVHTLSGSVHRQHRYHAKAHRTRGNPVLIVLAMN